MLQESPVASCIFPASVRELAISPESPGSHPQRVVLLIKLWGLSRDCLKSQYGQKMTYELPYSLTSPSPHFMESLEKYRKRSKKMKTDWPICPGRLDTRDWLAGVCNLTYSSHKISTNMYFFAEDILSLAFAILISPHLRRTWLAQHKCVWVYSLQFEFHCTQFSFTS